MKKLLFPLFLACFLAPMSLPAQGHGHDKMGDSAVKAACDCPPNCHCKKPGGTCPAGGPCVVGCECDENDAPTFESELQGPHETGLSKPVLTFDQFRAEQEYSEIAKRDGWTFEYDVRNLGTKTFGLVKPAHREIEPKQMASAFFAPGEEPAIPAKFNIKDFGRPLSGIFNQGSCGSCVYNSIVKNFQDSLLLRGVEVPVLSRSHLMNCGNDGQCRGSWGMNVAKDLVSLGGLFSDEVYPYRPVTARCQEKKGDLFGKIESRKEIDNDPKTIMLALLAGYPVSVTVGAGGAWGSYSSGVYNACSRANTNHEVLIYGWDCEDQTEVVGGKTVCKFDSNGKLPAGKGIWDVPNSWGEGWGEDGYMRTKMTSKSGALCNNLGEEAIILETGIPMPPLEPITFVLESKGVSLNITLEPTVRGWSKASLSESLLTVLTELEEQEE